MRRHAETTMSTLTIEYGFTDSAGKLHAGTIRRIPDGSMRHSRLVRLVSAWADAKPDHFLELRCYSNNAASRAVRAGVAALQPQPPATHS